ncbi:hypothetical protein D2E49_04300 [Mycobacteroides abscessus]|nr:hypothetical protein D2E49_04300 [Mycobacteroides abscessus]RIS31419.1 hypothetical protein D2E47_09030 [Mycobacteroides abscessus]RIU30423.1 hypothetical protein D2E96_20740 [Mycobacteroides abscessus]
MLGTQQLGAAAVKREYPLRLSAASAMMLTLHLGIEIVCNALKFVVHDRTRELFVHRVTA